MSLQALYAASTGMEAQMTRINNIANNISNLNTTAFKSSRESFEDLMYEQVQTPGTSNGQNTVAPVGIQLGHGTHLTGVYKHFSQGEFVQTDRELDIAIEGGGFLEVTQDNGQKAFTRDGGLRINSEGTVVTNQGLAISPNLTVPVNATSVKIAKDGTVTAAISGSTAPQELGTLQLVVFTNEAGLKSLGGNLYEETVASGSPTTTNAGENGAGFFQQGFLENSNVNLSEELIQMIVAQRSYEANSKVLSTASEMMKSSNNIV